MADSRSGSRAQQLRRSALQIRRRAGAIRRGQRCAAQHSCGDRSPLVASDREIPRAGRKAACVCGVQAPRTTPTYDLQLRAPSKAPGSSRCSRAVDRSQRVDMGQDGRCKLFVAQECRWLAGSSPPHDADVQVLGRNFDIEIKGHHLYLIANRSTAAGPAATMEEAARAYR